jgi:hypothetical protein
VHAWGWILQSIHSEESNARLAALLIYESPEHGDSHGGTHTHMDEFFKVPPEDGPAYNLILDYSNAANNAGDYFAIASVQMYKRCELGTR